MTSCPFHSNLQAFYDRELPETELQGFLAHLGTCGLCRAELQTLQAASRVLAEQTAVRPPEDFARKVMARIYENQETQEEVPYSFWDTLPIPRWEFLTTACAIALIFTYFAAHSLKSANATPPAPLLLAYAQEASGSWILSENEIEKEDVLRAAVTGNHWEEGSKEEASYER